SLGVVLFLIAAWLTGRETLRAYVPLDKPPPAMVDRAGEMIRTLGYTEPRFEHPMDREFGYVTADQELDSLARAVRSPHRWDVLRDPGGSFVTFWYRQSPIPLLGASGSVGAWNPFPQAPGEVGVGLALNGKLRMFSATPRRFAVDTLAGPDPDWTVPF